MFFSGWLTTAAQGSVPTCLRAPVGSVFVGITGIIRDRAHSTIKDIFSELSPAANSLGQLGGRHWAIQGCKVSVSCSVALF